eukprot:1307408-Amphidinium_carterae.1
MLKWVLVSLSFALTTAHHKICARFSDCMEVFMSPMARSEQLSTDILRKPDQLREGGGKLWHIKSAPKTHDYPTWGGTILILVRNRTPAVECVSTADIRNITIVLH